MSRPATGRGARQAYHHGALPDAALDAADALLSAAGADALSFRAVAAAAGVNHRALYRHYADRETLLDALAARGYGRLADAIQGSLAGAADPAAAFIAAYAGFALGEAELYALMMGRDRHRIFGHAGLKAAAFRVIGLSERVLAQDAPAGPERRDRIIALWSLLHGAITLYRSGLLRAGSRAQFVDYLLALAGRISPPAGRY